MPLFSATDGRFSAYRPAMVSSALGVGVTDTQRASLEYAQLGRTPNRPSASAFHRNHEEIMKRTKFVCRFIIRSRWPLRFQSQLLLPCRLVPKTDVGNTRLHRSPTLRTNQ